MATEADIPAPTCEIRREGEGGNAVDQATNVLINKLPLEEKIQVDTPNEPPMTEGENFLKMPPIGEVHCEVNSVLSDANKVTEKPIENESLANEGTFSKGIKRNDERVDTQLSKDATSDHHVIDDPEDENLNVQVKKEDDISFNIVGDVSKEEGCPKDQNMMTPEQDGLDNQRNIAEKLDAAADIASQENIAFTETISEVTSNSDDLDQSKNQGKTIDSVDTEKEVLESFSTVVSSCTEEGVSEDLLGVGSDSKERKTIEEVDAKKEELEKFLTVSNAEIEEKSMINVDGSEMKNTEDSGKESEETSSQLHLAREAVEDKSPVMHEGRVEGGEPREAESCENEKSTETTLLKIKAELEKPNNSPSVASEDVKAPDLVLDAKTDNKAVDATEIKEETHENFGTIVSTEKTEENAVIQVDGPHMENEAYLEKEIEKTSLKEALKDGAKDESTIIHEAKIGDEYLRNSEKNMDSTHDCKRYAASEDIETTCSLEEQSSSVTPRAIMSDRTIDSTEMKEVTLENVGTTVSQEDCSKMENEETLEKESGTSSSTEAPKEDYNNDESKKMHELSENRDADVINTKLLENKKHTSNLVKEEAQVEKPVDSLQIANKDVHECDSSQDAKVSSIGEQILTTDAQEVSDDKIEEKTFDAAETKVETLEDIAAYVPSGDNEENSPIEEDGSQKPSLEEASTCNISKYESAIIYEAKSVDKSSTKVDLFKNEKNVEDTSVKEKVSMESLQVAPQDSEAFASIQVGETSSLEEQSLAVNCKGTTNDHKEDKTNDSTSLEEETTQDKNVATIIPHKDTKEKSLDQDDCSQMEQPVDSLQVAITDIEASASGQDIEPSSIEKQIPTTDEILGGNEEKMIDPIHKNETAEQNVATTIPHEDIQENSLIQADCSEKEHEEHLEKESGNASLDKTATEEINKDESKSIHESDNRDNDVFKAELLENETTSSVVKEEAPLEKPIDSLQVDPDDINESNSCQDTKVNSSKERILTTIPQGISGDKIEGKSIKANDIKEATLEDNATNFSNGDDESPIKEDGSQKLYLGEDPIVNNNKDELTIKHEAKFVDESSTKADLSKNEKNTKDISVKEEVSIESLQEAAADIEAFASIQDRETSYVEEQSLNINREGTISDHKEDERNDATSVKEETPQDKNVETTVLYEDMQEKSLDQDNCSQVEQNKHLKKEIENQSLTKALTQDTEESTLIVEESPVEKAIDSLQEATEEIFGNDMEEKMIDLPYKNDKTPENIATTTLHDETQGALVIQVDCSKMEHEKHVEKESENASTTEVETEKTNEDKSRNEHEPNSRNDDAIRTELLENEKYTKEEACLEKSLDSSQADTEDIDESDSKQDTKMSSIEEQIPDANPQEILGDKIEGKTIDATKMEEKILEDIAANVPSGENKDNSPIEEDGSQEPCLEKASTLIVNEDKSTIMHEVKYVEESSTKTDLLENDENIEDNLVKEEVSIKSLQVVVEDIKESASIQDRETSSLGEQNVTINCQEIIGEHNEDKISHKIGIEEETPEDKNVATSIPYEDAGKHLLNQGDCLQMEHNEHLEKESEIPSSTEKTNDDESKNIHEVEYRDEDIIRAGLLENENYTESTSVKEEAHVEKSFNSLQVSTEDIKASDSSQYTKLSSIEEQILIAETQEISIGKIEERTTDAVELREDILKDAATNVLDGDNEGDSLIKEDDLQKTSSDESKFVDESPIKDGLLENKKNIEDTLVKEEVSEDIRAFDLVQDIETSSLKEQSLAVDCQGIIGDDTKEKTDDATSIKGQTPVDENVSTSIPFEDKGEKSREQNDHSHMEHHKNEGEILSEAPRGVTEERTLIIKETVVEKCVDSLQAASEGSEDIKAAASCQNTEKSPIEEQILTTNPQEISCDITEEKTINAAQTNEETTEVQNVTTTISHEEIEENSLNQVDCSQMEQKEHLEKESENLSSLTKAPIKDTIEKTSVKEEPQVEKPIDSFQLASENIKASTSGPDLETSFTEEKIQTTEPQEVSDDNIEEKFIDAVCNKKETLEDIATNVSNEDSEDGSPIKVDDPQKPSSQEASSGNATDYEPAIMHDAKFADENLIEADLFENEKNTEDILVREEVCIESVQVAAEDIKLSNLGQDKEPSSLEEQSLTPNPQGTMGDHKEHKTIDATKLKEETPESKNVATSVPQEDNEKNSIIPVDRSEMEYEEYLEEGSENSSSTKAPTVKEEITEDIKPPAPSQDTEISSVEEMILTEDSKEISRDNTREKNFLASGTMEETLEVQVFKAIENVDIKAKTTKLNEEEGYLDNLQMTTSVNISAHEDQVLDSSAIKIPNVNKDIMVDIADPKGKQEESSILNVSEEHINISKNAADVTILASEASELSGDHQVIKEANNCSDTTDAEKIRVLDDDSITVPPNKNLVETVAKESTDPEAQVQDGEKEMELIEEEPEADQKKIEEELTISASHDASKANGVNGEEENRSSDYGTEISKSADSVKLVEVSSPNVASEELSTSDLFQESTRVTKQEAVSEDAQKQDEDLHVLVPINVASEKLSTSNPFQESVEITKQEAVHEKGQKQDDDLHFLAPINDSSVENIKNDVQLCLTSAHVSDITQEMQKLDEASEPSTEEKIVEIIEKGDQEGSEVAEDSTQDKYIKHLDTTKSLLDDKKLTESEQEVKECKGEKRSTSVPVANNIPPTSSMEPSEAEKELKADTTESTVSLGDNVINNRSIGDVETKIDDEAPEIIETTRTFIGGQETKSEGVSETSILISQCEKDEHEHASLGSMIEDKLDSNAVQFEHKENKSVNESKNQVLESIAQVQSCDIISKAEETKTHEENLEATVEINSIAKDISEPKEIVKVDISSNKIKREDKDVEDYHLGSCMEEVITKNSQEDEVKQEEMPNEVIKNANETEKVPKVSKEISSFNMAAEELSRSDPFQESTRVTEKEALSEEAQKKDEDREKDVQLCLTSAHVSDVTQETQKLEEASGPSADEKIEEITEKMDHEESEAVEDSTQDKYIENLKQDDTTKSFLEDKKLSESEQEKEEYNGEKGSTSVPMANTIPPMSSTEPLEDEKELKADTTESAVSLEDSFINSRSIVDLETKIDDQASEITETATTITEGQETESRSIGETSVVISQSEKDEYEHAPIGSVIEEKSDSNEVGFANEENKSINESKSRVLESSAQVQSCDIISKAEEATTDEENHEAAIEINSAADDRSEPKEIIKVDISRNKIKGKDEDVEDYHLGSCTEEVITKNRLEDEVKQEEKINIEEILDEVITNANDTEKVPKVSEEADDKATVEPEDNLLANESIDKSLHQEECGKNVKELITASDIKEAPVLDHIHTKTDTEDSTTEVNSSSVAFLEDGDNRKGADGVNNEPAKDEVLLNQDTNTAVLDSAAQPERPDENIICDAAPTKTVQKTIKEIEEENTTMMEQQQQDNINKHERLPLPESAQGKESEKRDQKDEISSSHEVQAKDEENQMLSAGKSKEEAHEADICSKPDEHEDRKTYAEAKKLEFSTHAKDTSEVSHSDGAAHGIPEDNENSTTINESSEEKYQSKSTESQVSTVRRDIELIEEGPQGTRIIAEMQGTEAQSFSNVVPEQMGVDSQQVEELTDESEGMTSTSIQPSKVSTSEIILENKVESSSEAKDQLTELHNLLEESHDVGSKVKMAQRDGPLDLQKVTNVSEDVQKLKEGFIEVSNKENLVEANPNENIKATASSEEHEAGAIQKALTSKTLKPNIQEQQPGRTSEAVIEAKASNHQSSMEDAAQTIENKESQRQEELVATSPPAKDKNETLEADHTKNVNPENSPGNKNISVIQHGSPAECSQGEGEGEILKTSKCEPEEPNCGQETTKSKETYKHSLSDLHQVSVKESSQMAYHSAIEKEPIIHIEDLQEEKTDNAKLEHAKTDEEKDEEEESTEQRKSNLGSEAPVMAEAGDADVKVTHKKSHSILSGVGSKVKHSIAKVKKAITGKSSHPKPPSPKEGDKYSKTVVS